MASKGAIYKYKYVIDGVESGVSPRTVPTGKTVTLKLEVYNGGTTSGLVVGKITHNDELCRYGYKKDRGVGTSNRFDIECSFVMGARDERVDYYAYHEYEGSADAHRVITFTVAAAPAEMACTQLVSVRKKHTSNIYLKGVTVEARPSSGVGAVVRGVTGGDGRCRLALIKNEVYFILIPSPPSGYTCERASDCEERGVTACSSEIEFFLTGEAEYPGAARWKHIDAGTWNRDKTKVTFEYEVEKPNPEKLEGRCRYTYRGFARWGTKTADGGSVSACGPRTNTITLWSVAPGSKIQIQLERFDLKDYTRLKDIDRETVTIPAKDVPVAAELTVKVNAPGYNIREQKDRATFSCTPVRKATDEYECKLWLGLEQYPRGEVPFAGGRSCDDFEMVFFKIGVGDWAVDEVRSSPCAGLFRYTGTGTSITLTKKEVPVENKIIVKVGAGFKLNEIKCGEMLPAPLLIPKPIGYDVCKKTVPPNKIVEFTAADGLIEGHHYVFVIYPITWLDQVLNNQVIEFKGVKNVALENITFIDKPICELMGIDPASPECKDEIAMFIDPIYAYDTLNKIINHKDMHGNPAEPETLDYVLLPIVLAGSLVPMPVGKGTKLLSKMSGRLAKAANTVVKKKFLVTHQKMIHQLAAVGDDVNLRTFWDEFELDHLQKCENILKQAAEVAGRSDANRVLMRTNMGKWIRGIRNKWKSTPSLKTKIDDIEKGADGNIFKSFESTISSHFDDAAKAGDWKKAHEIYHSAAMSVDDFAAIERNLAKYSPEFRRMHNIMRYGNDDFIKFLKSEKAVVPEFANRFDEGIDYLIRHIGEETGQEVGAYKVILDALPESEVATIVRNLSGAGKSAASAITHVLKADTAKGMGAFYSAAAKGIDKGAKLSKKEAKAVAASLRTKLDDAAKTMTPKETAAVEKFLKTDDAVKHPKLARLWKYIHGKEGAEHFRDFPLWKKAAIIGAGFFAVSEVWKRTMDFCMALFIGEETIQWAGFGGIVLNSLTYNWDEKTLSEKKKLIQIFKDFRDKRQKIHDLVTSGAGLFETLCIVFGQIYRNFWEADSISLWALDQKIADMEKGIDPLAGLGECTLIAQADKKGVAFYVHGETQKYYSGAAFSKVYIPDVLVRDKPYKVVLCAEKDGYVSPLMQPIRITEEDLGDKISTPLFNMVPDTEAGTDPFDGRSYTDAEYNKLAEKPEKPEVAKFGKIVCSTAPPGARIYLDGVYKNALTNWTLEYVPVGKHTVLFKMDGHEDCAVDVTVAVEPDTQAYCNLEGVEGGISFKCAHNDGYCPRGATIQYRKKGDSTWATFGKKTSSYAVTKTDLDAGVYEVKYNLLNVMGCEGEVTVRAGEITDFNKQMSSILPEFQLDPSSSVARIQTRVTAIVDGDSLRTEYTDNPSVLPPPNPSYAQQRIRIIGYDSEECEDYPDVCAPGGKEAGDMLKKLIPVGSEIELRVYRWLPLGAHNRIIAGVFKNGVDIAKKMLNSCLVQLAASKYYDKYPWIKWKGEDSYEEAWCDPNETNVTISTSDAYGASMNVDVIMFDNEMKSSAEGGVTIKKVRPGKHTVEIRDDILKDKKLWAFVQPLNQAFKAPCIFEIDVRPGETYRVRVKLGVKAGEPVDNARQITFSASPLSARIHVDERVYVQMTGEVTKIPMTIGKSQSIEYQANDYAPLKAELLVTADNIKCTATDVCGYKTSRPYVLVTKDYVRAFLKSLPTADFWAESFDEWMRKKGGAEGISTDEVLRISQAYKGKKDIGFMPTLDDIIDAVSDYLDRKP